MQSYHWSPPQSTIHPFALQYYRVDREVVDEIRYVVISDCLENNAATYYCFHHEVMVEMKRLVEGLEKYICFLMVVARSTRVIKAFLT